MHWRLCARARRLRQGAGRCPFGRGSMRRWACSRSSPRLLPLRCTVRLRLRRTAAPRTSCLCGGIASHARGGARGLGAAPALTPPACLLRLARALRPEGSSRAPGRQGGPGDASAAGGPAWWAHAPERVTVTRHAAPDSGAAFPKNIRGPDGVMMRRCASRWAQMSPVSPSSSVFRCRTPLVALERVSVGAQLLRTSWTAA